MRTETARRSDREGPVAQAVRAGLSAAAKALPPFLFYDQRGSELFERITELPEYYLTRAERSIFAEQGEALVGAAAALAGGRLEVLELGAGTASKTELLLAALVRRQGGARYFAADVSATPVAEATRRLARSLPALQVVPLLASHEAALAQLERHPGRLLVLFVGSSIGNYDDADASALLAGIRATLGRSGVLLLGTDLRKAPQVLVRAYDDAAGVTAAFNLNLLTRLNRELGGRFELDRFRHVALWNSVASRIEMHLESLRDQVVGIDALRLSVHFRAGERIHTESSYKYDEAHVDRLLGAAGLVRASSFHDDARQFAVHLARPA